MPVRYVGKPSSYKGKVLFDILCNLKDFGKGRVVVRNIYRQRYAEPSFYHVVRAEPEMDPENMYGKVWADFVFRGIAKGIITIEDTQTKDFQLLSREEEAEYCKNIKTNVPARILPATCKFPPLFKELILRDRKAMGLLVDEEPQLPLIYEDNDLYRGAKPGEQPTEQIEERLAAKIHLDTIDFSKPSIKA